MSISTQPEPFSRERCAGLAFNTRDGWCCFRADCGIAFDWPLDPASAYALIDLETDLAIGVLAAGEFTGFEESALFRVFALRPLLEQVRSL